MDTEPAFLAIAARHCAWVSLVLKMMYTSFQWIFFFEYNVYFVEGVFSGANA